MHRPAGFDPALLSHTFSWSTWGNGLVAILSGVAANLVADWFGLVAPFMLAIVTFAIGGAVIWLTWSENYGQQTVGDRGTPVEQPAPSGPLFIPARRVNGPACARRATYGKPVSEYQLVRIAQDWHGRMSQRYAWLRFWCPYRPQQ